MPKEYDAVPLTALETLPLALQNFIAHCGPDGILGKIDIQGLTDFLVPLIANIGATPFIENTGSPLPNPVDKDSGITIVGAGTFAQTTGSDIVTTEALNVLFWDGTSWSVGVEVPIDLTDYATIDMVPVMSVDDSELARGIVELPTEPAMPGKTISSNSTITDNVDFNLSDYYKVIPGHTIKLSSINGSQYSNYVGIYDENKVPAGNRLGTGVGTANAEYTIPEGVSYVVFFHGRVTGSEVYPIRIDFGVLQADKISVGSLEFDFSKLNPIIDQVGDVATMTGDIVTERPLYAAFTNKNIASDGTITDDGDFDLSDYFAVNGGTDLIMTLFQPVRYSNVIGLYDENYDPIGRLGTGTTTSQTTHAIPSNAKYFIVYYRRVSTNEFYYPLLTYSQFDETETNASIIKTADGSVFNIQALFRYLNQFSVAGIYGKKVFILGDSISVATTAGNTSQTVWWGLLKSMFNLDVQVSAISGTKIGYNNSGDSDLISMSDPARWLDSVPVGWVPDLIIVFGGTNDFGSTGSDPTTLGTISDPRPAAYSEFDSSTTFYSALKFLYNQLTLTYRRSVIVHMEPLARADKGSSMEHEGQKLTDFVVAINEVSKINGVTVLHTFNESGITYNNLNSDTVYSPDQLHPKPAAMPLIANYVASKLKDRFS